MVQVIGNWDQQLAQFGNKPGLNEGDVLIVLSTPVDGMKSVRCAAADLFVGDEAGSVIGLLLVLPDGRHLLVPWANVVGIIDAPAESP